MRSEVLLVGALAVAVFAGCLGADDDVSTGAARDPPPGGFSTLAVPLGDYSFEEAYSVTVQPGPHTIGATEVVYLDGAADGAAIQIGVVRPDVPEGERVPVITIASPYFAPLQSVDLKDYYPRLVKNFVPHGYALAFLAVRGSADSGGCSELFGPLERADLSQGITWLGTQEWSNGNVGMIGGSYDGATQWQVAAMGNPHLKTIVPVSGVPDPFDLYRNGTTEWRMLGALSALYWTYGFAENHPANGRDVDRTVDGVACPSAYRGIAASALSGLTGERDPLGYWAERNQRPGVEADYNGSILLVHGLQDWNADPHLSYPWMSVLEERGLVVKHLLGQWAHAWPDNPPDDHQRWDWAQKLLQWYDYWLKGDLTADLGPRAEVQDSGLRWRMEDTWPPRDTTPLPLYLAPGLGLMDERPSGTQEVPVGPDPSLALGSPLVAGGQMVCPACAVFTAAPVEAEELRFAGLPRLHITVIPSAPTGHLSAFLFAKREIEGAAEWQRLGWTQMDVRFHAGGETAQVVVPGEPIVMRMQFEPLDAVVLPGDRLVLVLNQGSEYDRTPVTPFVPMRVVAGKDSVMILDTVERDESVFFDVPKE